MTNRPNYNITNSNYASWRMPSSNSTINRNKVYFFFAIFIIGNLSMGIGASLLLAVLPIILLIDDFKVDRNPIVVYLFVLLLLTVILSFSPSIKRSALYFEEIIKQISWVVLAIVGSKFKEEEARLFFILFLISMLVCSPLIVLSTLRFRGYFPHSNHLAYFLLLPLLHFILTKNDDKRWFYVFMLFCISVITKSSGGTATFLAVLMVYFFYERKISLKLLILVIIGAAALIPIIYYSGAYDIFYSKVESVDLEQISDKADRMSFGSEGSLVWRMTYWKVLVDTFLQSSDNSKLLFGEGVKTLTSGNYIYSFMVRDPHNDYIRLFIERGIIGAIVFFGIFLKIIFKTQHKLILSFVLFIPMFFGNIVVSFPFMFSFIILISMLCNKNDKNY